MASPETRDKIINTAARLFAEFGFHGVSLRTIAKEAGIQASLAQYHFKTKELVFRAVFERCILPINHDRHLKLDAAAAKSAQGETLGLEDIVRAFLEPTIQLTRDRSSHVPYYGQLISQITNDPQEHARSISREFTDPIARQTLAAMKSVLPDVDQATLTWCYLFGVGAMVAAISRTGRARLLSNGACDPDNAVEITSILVPFVTGGIRAAISAKAKSSVKDGGERPLLKTKPKNVDADNSAPPRKSARAGVLQAKKKRPHERKRRI